MGRRPVVYICPDCRGRVTEAERFSHHCPRGGDSSGSGIALSVLTGPSAGQTYGLDGAPVTIGRDSDNRLLLPEDDLTASRHHAEVRVEGAEYIISDVGSLNGTFVNNRRVVCEVLHSGDEIQVGTTMLSFVGGGNGGTGTARDPEQAIVGAPYEILGFIGDGSMAQVYKARRWDGDIVAIKKLKPEYSTDPEFVERFRREVEDSKGLRHPNIIRVYEDSGCTYGEPMLIMEYVSNGSLRGWIHPETPLDMTQVGSIARQCCAGLGCAHRQGIVHRDVKPENVLIDPQNTMKIADFGIAHRLTRHTVVCGRILGTPYYMSPEQARGETVDSRSDIYSLCIVMYELCTGRVPFVGDTYTVVLEQHKMAEPEPVGRYRYDIPPAVEQAIMRGLSKNQRERQQSTEELARSLDCV